MDRAGECGLIDMREGQGQRALEIREADATLFLRDLFPFSSLAFLKWTSSFLTVPEAQVILGSQFGQRSRFPLESVFSFLTDSFVLRLW